jgi:hypothetical protein
VTADGGDNGCISDSLHGGEGVRSAPRLTKEDARAVMGWLTMRRVRRRCGNIAGASQ